MILSILRHTDGHITAAEILEGVKKKYPYVDISTVYRTMSALKDLHLISETDMGERRVPLRVGRRRSPIIT